MAKPKQFGMTDGEISNDFRLAKNKREMVSILADQNLVSPYQMAMKLDELGMLKPAGLSADTFSNHFNPPRGVNQKTSPGGKDSIKVEPAKIGRPAAPPIDESAAMAMYLNGARDAEIAAELGVGIKRVRKWREKNDLKCQPRHPAAPPLDEIRAMDLWNEGADDIAMSEALGVSITRVREWRLRMHLRRPRGYAARKGHTEHTETEDANMESKSTPQGTDEASVEAPAPAEARPGGKFRMELRQDEKPAAGTGWTVNDFSMVHRCIGVIEGIAEGIVVNVGAKERLLQAARTICELMEKTRIDTTQEV